jgi:hypothetical protein
MRNRGRKASQLAQRDKVAGLLAATALIALGLLFAVSAALALIKARQSDSWIPVDAVLLDDRMESSGKSEYRTVKYGYEFGEKSYASKKVCFGMSASGFDHLQIPAVGGSIRAYVNPSLPSESVLVRNSCGSWIFLAVGSGLILMGLLVGALSIKGYRQRLSALGASPARA